MTFLKNMRAIEIKPFRAVSSGLKTFEELFRPGGFCTWQQAHSELFVHPIYDEPAFLWHEEGKNIFVLAIRDEVTEADVSPYEIITFPGGMFLVGTGDESNPDDLNETIDCMMDWIAQSDVFEYGDFPKSGMCNMANPDGAIDRALGIAQQQIFLPLKFRAK